MVISSRKQAEISCNQSRKVWGMFQCCHIVLWWEILYQDWPVRWSIVVKEKPTVGSPFFEALRSGRIPKVTMHIGANLWDRNFPLAAIPVNYTSEFRESFKTNTYMQYTELCWPNLVRIICPISWYSVDTKCTGRPNKKSTLTSED